MGRRKKFGEMKKEFTPKQVMSGDVEYSIEEFLLDLFNEVTSSISMDDLNSTSEEAQDSKYKNTVNEVFRFVSEICFMAAINSPDLKLLVEKGKRKDAEIIMKTLESNKLHINLLKALFTKQVASGLESGLSKRQAAKQVITQNKGKLIEFLGRTAREFPN